MEAETVEFQDWEVLPKSDDTALVVHSSSSSSPLVSVVLDPTSTNLDEGESEGMIRYDYFSLENKCRYAKSVSQGDVSEESSVDSDNPSWIDPGAAEHHYGSKHPAEFWSDSGSDRSEERKFGGFDASNELGLSGDFSPDPESIVISDLNSIRELDLLEKSKSVDFFEKYGEIGRWDKNPDRGLSDVGITYGNVAQTLGVSNDLDCGSGVQEGEGGCSAQEKSLDVTEVNHDVKFGSEGAKMRIVWWKVPFEVLKYCLYRVGPMWSFSVATAFVGFIFLGRKLYKMKRKSPGLQLKVTMDDKKVSQFMTHAARLNEAFSVVRRVPIIRPSLPISGATPWHVMSLR